MSRKDMNQELTTSRGSHREAKGIRYAWYKFTRNPLSIVGLVIILSVLVIAALAPVISPFPEDVGFVVHFDSANQPPSWAHPFGTDVYGRDIMTRVFYGFRFSLLMGIVVISIAPPIGVVLGMLAGYKRGTWIDTVLMRITDIFLALPPLLLALSVSAALGPGLMKGMMAVSFSLWPWYARLTYGVATSLRNEGFVRANELAGGSTFFILRTELFPNCIRPVLTKMTLDLGFVVIVAASLSFVGLGVQPPKPGLGTMVSEGAKVLPGQWWVAVFPALAIVYLVLGFNLLGDGLQDFFSSEEL